MCKGTEVWDSICPLQGPHSLLCLERKIWEMRLGGHLERSSIAPLGDMDFVLEANESHRGVCTFLLPLMNPISNHTEKQDGFSRTG